MKSAFADTETNSSVECYQFDYIEEFPYITTKCCQDYIGKTTKTTTYYIGKNCPPPQVSTVTVAGVYGTNCCA